MSAQKRRVAVIGLDCASPQLVFEQWKDELPTLQALMKKGWHGPMMRSIPAITCPAWMSMMTGPDDANHAQEGSFIFHDPAVSQASKPNPGYFHILDVTPTILQLLGVPVPQDLEGKAVQID